MSDLNAAAHDHVEHPTWKQYKWVGFWLLVITAIEVWVYYTPFKDSKLFAPTLLLMSVLISLLWMKVELGYSCPPQAASASVRAAMNIAAPSRR